MSDEKTVYKASDIVFVKLSGCWWPGEVQDVESLPEEVKEDLGEDCIAVVKYFDEDYYEPIYKEKDIYPYDCAEKQDFIEKAMARYRNKIKDGSSVLKKLPEDLKKAEKLTGGSVELIDQLMTLTKPLKISYGDIFSPSAAKKRSITPKVEVDDTPKGGKMSHPETPKSGKRKMEPESTSENSQGAAKTPRLVKNKEVTPKMLKVSTLSSGKSKIVPKTSESPVVTGFQCEYCNFNTNRLNLIILHRKSHTDGVLPIEKKPELPKEMPKKAYRSKAKDKTPAVAAVPALVTTRSELAFDNLVGVSTSDKVNLADTSRKRSRKNESPQRANVPSSNISQPATPHRAEKTSSKKKPGTPSKSTSLLSEFSKKKASPSKKTSPLKQDPAKSAEIKSKLLADWGVEDDDELARPLGDKEKSDNEETVTDNVLLSTRSDDEDDDIYSCRVKSADVVTEEADEAVIKCAEEGEKEIKKFEDEIESLLETTAVPEIPGIHIGLSESGPLGASPALKDSEIGEMLLTTVEETTVEVIEVRKEESAETEVVESHKGPKIIAATETEPATHPTESILDTSHLQPVHKTIPIPADFTGVAIANETVTVASVSTIASAQEGESGAVLQQEMAVPSPALVLSPAVVIQDGQILAQAPTDIDGETYVFVALDDADTANLNGATFVAYADSQDTSEQTYYLDTNSIGQNESVGSLVFDRHPNALGKKE